MQAISPYMGNGNYIMAKRARELMSVEERIVILCAVRYSMGRMSYAPSSVISYIRDNAGRIGVDQLPKFIRNLREDFKQIPSDHFAYREEWANLIEDLKRYIALSED